MTGAAIAPDRAPVGSEIGAASGDRIAKDLADRGAEALCGLKFTARFNGSEHSEEFRRGDFPNRAVAERGKGQPQKPLRLGDCDHCLLLTTLLINQFSRDGRERVIRRVGLFDLGLFPRFGRIDAVGQQPPGLSPRCASFLEADARIDADRKQLLTAREAVSEAPALRAVRRHPELEAAAIGKFGDFGLRLG